MKALLALLLLAVSASAFSDQYVNGYFRKDGTYVPPHYQTSPDTTRLNNYSTRGNINPYTGTPGTVNPYPQPGLAQPQLAPYPSPYPQFPR